MALTIPGKRGASPTAPSAPARQTPAATPAGKAPAPPTMAPLLVPGGNGKPAPDAASVRVATLGKALTDLAGSSVGHVHDSDAAARGRLTVGAILTNAPFALGKPAPEANSGVSNFVLPHGITIIHDHVRPGADGKPVDTGLMATVMRGNVELDAARTVDGHKVVGGVSVENGYADASGQLRWATRDGGVVAAGGFVGVTKGSVFVGGSTRVADAVGNTAAVSAFGRVNASRTVADLGDDAGKRFIELRRSAGLGGMFAPGWVTSMLGVGGRLTVDKNKAVVLRTHVEPERARELLFEKKGVLGFFRDKGRALGLVDDPIKLPSLADPELLAVGDEVVISTSGSLMGGVALGALGMRVGAEAITQGDFDMGVKKLDATHVQLVVTPTEVRGLEVFVDSPLLLEVRATRTQAASLRQAFTFDLSSETGRNAYQKALLGQLPSGLGKAALETPDGRTLADVVRREKLPAGVSRDYLEQAQLQRSNVGAGLGFALVESGSLAGLSLSRARTQEDAVVTDGRVAVDTRTRGVEKRREVLLSGTETAGVFASARKVMEFDAAGKATEIFQGLAITARFSDDKVRGLELNGDVLRPLNEALGTTLPPFTHDAHHEKRTVTAARTLSADDLLALVRLNPQRLSNAANQAGLTVTDALLLQEELAACADVEAQAAAVQRFVAAYGLDGFGFVHRALPRKDALQVTTTSSAYSVPVATVDTLAFKYPAPVSAQDSPERLVERFKDVRNVLREADLALADVKDDVLLDDGARSSIAHALSQARQRAQSLFPVAALATQDCQLLRDGLGQGWVSSDEQALLDALDLAQGA